MIDPKLLREDFDAASARLQTRGLPENFAMWPDLDRKRRQLLQRVEEIRANKHSLGPEIARAKKQGTDCDKLISDLQESSRLEKELGDELAQVEKSLESIELITPNLPDESVPIGKDETANQVVLEWGDKPQLEFTPMPHWEIGERLGILDFERAAKLSGARFAVYLGDGARLERALINFMLEEHAKKGYKEVIPPLLVRQSTMVGSGQLPKFEADAFKTTGQDEVLYLIPTSEVALCNLHSGEILDGQQLPLYYTAYSPCFRSEAGSYGKDVRGLIRLHQFNKVELVKICSEETSYDELEKLAGDAESILQKLDLCYRKVVLSSGDMGIASAKTYDLEVWLPGQGCYREISSCSNTTDYQARRTKTRYRKAKGEKPRLVHMLNGSGLAVGRTLVAVLENYQQADGSVVIPPVLRPYMGGQDVIR